MTQKKAAEEERDNLGVTCTRREDFSKWYNEVVLKSQLADFSSVKGFMVIRPAGYALWECIREFLDAEFKNTGHENMYMPALIPEKLLLKEKEHVEGFSPEEAEGVAERTVREWHLHRAEVSPLPSKTRPPAPGEDPGSKTA